MQSSKQDCSSSFDGFSTGRPRNTRLNGYSLREEDVSVLGSSQHSAQTDIVCFVPCVCDSVFKGEKDNR